MEALDRLSIKDDICLCLKVLQYVQTGTVTRSYYKRPCKWRLTFEQDLTICREVLTTWGMILKEPEVPPEIFFEKNVAGRNPILDRIDWNILSQRFKGNLLQKLQSSILADRRSCRSILDG